MDTKEYLPFYLGQQVSIQRDLSPDPLPPKTELLEAGLLYDITIRSVEFKKCWIVKLILRELSSMTEEDIKEWGEVKITHTPYCVELDSCDHFGEFTEIFPDGTIHSRSKDDGDTRPIKGGELFRLLCKKGFDIFGLIENNLAIKK